MYELWLAIAIMYNIGNPSNSPYRIVNTGPFKSQEECITRVQQDKAGLFSYYDQQGYKVIDIYCVEVNEENSVIDTPMSEI